MAEKPAPRSGADLRATLDDITGLLMTIRREQLQLEAYGQVTRLALGALLRALTPEARAAVADRLSEPAESLLGPDIPAASPLGKAVIEEAGRMAAALRG
jgi:hypothetical protein